MFYMHASQHIIHSIYLVIHFFTLLILQTLLPAQEVRSQILMILLSGGGDRGESLYLLKRMEEMREMRVMMVTEGGKEANEAELESKEDLLERLGGL